MGEETESRAANVIEALQRVMRDLPGIGKDSEASPQQGGYKYRGIEAITREAQPLFARHGVVMVPRVVEWRPTREIVVNSKPWTDESCLVEYDCYGPGGIEDRIVVGPIPAIGRDNADKGANKCMTQAMKYALIQVLCISDAKDDADGQTHERDSIDRTDEVPPDEQARRLLYVRIKELTDEQREKLGALTEQEGIPKKLGEWTPDHMARLADLLDELGSETASEGEPVDEAAMAHAREIVGRMEDISLVKDHLQARGLRRDGTHEAMRERLVLAMYEEAKGQGPAIAPDSSPGAPQPGTGEGKDPENGTANHSARSEDLDICAECGHTIDPDRDERLDYRADGEPVHAVACPAPSGALL